MSTLKISNLQAGIPGKQILNGIELTVKSGEVHAIMGPNGAGKSTMSGVIMGKPGYDVISGSVSIDGEELLGRPAWERALAGLHLVMQYPTEVPGVHIDDVMREAFATRGRDAKELDALIASEAARINFSTDLVARSLNVDLSGGEKKRNETLQLSLLKPKFAILDELDSGLDIDALRDCARRDDRGQPGGSRDHPLRAVARRTEAGLRAHSRRGQDREVGRTRVGRRAGEVGLRRFSVTIRSGRTSGTDRSSRRPTSPAGR